MACSSCSKKRRIAGFKKSGKSKVFNNVAMIGIGTIAEGFLAGALGALGSLGADDKTRGLITAGAGVAMAMQTNESLSLIGMGVASGGALRIAKSTGIIKGLSPASSNYYGRQHQIAGGYEDDVMVYG